MKDSFLFDKGILNSERGDILRDLKAALRRWGATNKAFEVVIKEPSRSDRSLRAYWVLIDIVQKWMHDKGSAYTKEMVSDYFKLKSGHSMITKDFLELPKSIAANSDCTWEDMKRLIETIEQFGVDNGIEGCRIESNDLKEMEEYYVR